MATNALLTIDGSQWSGDDEPQRIRLTTEGQFLRQEKGWVVTYDESEATGMAGTKTYIKVFDDRAIVLNRTGSHQMRLNFKAGERNITRMSTPYGDLDVAIYTSLVEAKLDPSGGSIRLGYTININNREQLNTRLDIEIQKSV